MADPGAGWKLWIIKFKLWQKYYYNRSGKTEHHLNISVKSQQIDVKSLEFRKCRPSCGTNKGFLPDGR